MALNPKQLKEAEEILKRLNPLLQKLGETKLDLDIIKNSKDLDDLNNLLSDTEFKISELEDGFGGLFNAIKNITREFKPGFVDPIKTATSSFTKLKSLAQAFSDDQAKINILTKSQIQNNIEILRSEQSKLSRIREELELKDDLTQSEKALLNNLKSEFSVTDDLIRQANKRLEKEIQIQKQIGLTGSFIKGISKIPILGNAIDTERALKSARDSAEAGASKFNVMKSALGEVKKDVKTALTDPLTIVSFLTQQFISTLTSVDKQTGDLAKNFNLSYKESSNLRTELNSIANSSKDINVTTKGLQESLLAVGTSLGTNAKLNDKDLITFTKLREQAGLTNEELVGMQKLTLVTGGTLESNTKSLMAAAGSVSSTTGVMLNQKTILQEVSKTSNSIKLSLGSNPEALGKAVAQAKALGMSLDQVNSIADKMLDIESSISSELEAELLTGKNLNLEQARLYALNNDMEGLSKEIAKNFGSAAEFSKMNRIQQEAAAKAVGMSREELASSLVEQQSLGKVSKEAFESRVKEVGLEKAQKELREGQYDKMMNQQSLQEKLTASVEKLKEVFVSLIQPLMPVLDAFSSILGMIGKIVEFTGDWGKYIFGAVVAVKAFQAAQKSALLMSMGKAIMDVISSNATIPIIGTALGLAAAGTVAALGAKYMTGNDVVSPGYGKRTLFGPEGAIALNDKDTVIAGTKLFGDDTISKPNESTQFKNEGQIKLNQPSTSTNIDISPLVNELQAVKAVLNQILSKEGTIMLDGTKVGTALNIGTSKIQ